MPGIDKSRFIGLRESDDELTCGICLAILNEPVVTPCCGKTFCGDCVRPWLQLRHTCPNDRKQLNPNRLIQPPLALKNILDKLQIMCDFNHNGCDKSGSLGQLKNHIKKCRYNPEAICVDCNERNGDINKHDCVNNLSVKNKSLEISNKELVMKYNAFVEKVRKDNNDREMTVREIFESNTKLIEEKMQLKSDKCEMNNRLNDMVKSNNKSNKQLKDSIKQMQNEFMKIEQNLEIENEMIANQNNKEVSEEQEEVEVEEEEDNKTLLNFSFQCRIENVRLLEAGRCAYSRPIFAHGFKWRLMICHHIDTDKIEYMKGFLECINCDNSTKWSIDANCEIKLLSSIAGRECAQKFKHKFAPENDIMGFTNFIRWYSVLDPKNGYFINNYKTDNSITLEAVISPVIHRTLNLIRTNK